MNNPENKSLINFIFPLASAIAIMALASLPLWVGHASETSDILFRGTFFDEADYAVHLSMMQSGRMGDWMYQMRFTEEPHQPTFLRMFYIMLGHVSRWAGLDLVTTFQIARWLFGSTAIYTIYLLCQKLFNNINHVRAAFFLAVLGAGAGWFQLLLGIPLTPISPIDFWLIDAYVFFSISLFPSFSFSLTLMVWALKLFLDYLETGRSKTIFLVSLLAVISQTTNPISFMVVDIAFAGAVFTSWWKNQKIEPRHIAALVMIALAQLPLLIYNFLILSRAPFWSLFTTQNETLSPPPVFYIWGFAPFWLFAFYGIFLALREQNPKMLAMTVWVAAGFSLAYLPVAIQRRFILGITIPLAILAINGLGKLLHQLFKSTKRENLILFSYILLASISTVYLSLGSSLFLKTTPTNKFYPHDLENALIWLDKTARPNDFVLADISTSQIVAQRTQLKVFVGHEIETLYFSEKKLEMEAFYKGNPSPNWLTHTKIQWVIYGPYEKNISSSFAADSVLEKVYQNNSVSIYKVNNRPTRQNQ